MRRHGAAAAGALTLALAAALPAQAQTGAAEGDGEVDSLIVSYAPGVDPVDEEGEVTGAASITGAELRAGADLGLGLRTVRLTETLSEFEAAAVADQLASAPSVQWAEPDVTVEVPEATRTEPASPTTPQDAPDLSAAASFQEEPPWGLDRIDQRAGTDGRYHFTNTGAGVTAYVLDSGIRASHEELAGRVAEGYTTVADAHGTDDCNGHGTHVAGTLGGTSSGVAKEVTLVPVRVMDCAGSGATSDVIDAISWVIDHHPEGVPAVANLSLAGDPSDALDTAVRALVADGVTTVVAAGNEPRPACELSPGREPAVITVAASTIDDEAAPTSNHGPCTDLYAPGERILSASHLGDDVAVFSSGTSMAAPHVAGVAARILEVAPHSSPAEVWQAIDSTATPVDFAPDATPDKLLYSGAADVPLPGPAPDPPEPPVPAPPLPTQHMRLAGDDRYATSAAIADASYLAPAPVVYLAAGHGFADALAGAPVAARSGAPVLLVKPDGVPATTRAQLEQLQPRRLVVLGGPQAVAPGTVAELEDITGATVERVAGANRYATSALLSATSYDRDVPVVYVAGGQDRTTAEATADALAGAAAAGARAGGPMLLVQQDGVPAVVAEELASLRPERVVVLGGPEVVSEATRAELERLSGAPVARVDGPHRYATAAALTAEVFAPEVPVLYVANGTAFADALSGAPVAGMQEAPVLLVQRDHVPAVVAAEVRRLSPEHVVVLGGPEVVSAAVARELEGHAG